MEYGISCHAEYNLSEGAIFFFYCDVQCPDKKIRPPFNKHVHPTRLCPFPNVIFSQMAQNPRRGATAGSSFRDIAAHLGIPRTTVQSVYYHFQQTGFLEPLKCPGRPPKLTERGKRGLTRYVQQNRRAPLSEITNAVPSNFSERTVRRALHEAEIFARVAPKKPYLSALHQQKRLAFAQKYRSWTAAQWEKIIWTDESSFEVGKAFRQVLVWRRSYEKYYPDCLAPTFKSGRTSVMIYAAFAGCEKLYIVFMPKGKRKAVDFVRLCYEGEYCLKSFRQRINIPDLILMEDGAPVHRSKAQKRGGRRKD
ncbi:hypothetical protein PsorP6_001594 [Peronosclerospora sorghi]|uniref:Uncharacterized protein n=1 Tax=Peronosclerospora sorghi TaxID=230839 RepID=A0ACC0WTD8_9STRA|nr:hypothetical protein PsorP6_001594 [Peronosclerospora sorghi]